MQNFEFIVLSLEQEVSRNANPHWLIAYTLARKVCGSGEGRCGGMFRVAIRGACRDLRLVCNVEMIFLLVFRGWQICLLELGGEVQVNFNKNT